MGGLGLTDEGTRRRLIGVLVGGNALSSTAFIGVATIAPIVGATLTGSPTLAGVPSTAATVGTAAGAMVLGWAGARIGRRRSFALGFATAAVGSALAGVAVAGDAFPLFVVALLVVGFGRSASQLARYAAGDLRDESRRGRAISVVVWASTVGAVVGPLLIGPAGDAARASGRSELLGPVVLAAVGFALAGVAIVALLRPDPLDLAVSTDPTVDGEDVAHPRALRMGPLVRRPTVALSLVALVMSQAVMVLVMTMTPVHIRAAGGDLRTVGWVMMAHTLGMFAIAPATGWFVDRVGSRRVIAAGAGVLVVSCLAAATAGGAETWILVAALFGLGVGWNFGFVAASALLQEGLSIPERVRLQGLADASAWIAGGVGAGASGVIVASSSYPILALVGATAATAIVVALGVARRSAPAT